MTDLVFNDRSKVITLLLQLLITPATFALKYIEIMMRHLYMKYTVRQISMYGQRHLLVILFNVGLMKLC